MEIKAVIKEAKMNSPERNSVFLSFPYDLRVLEVVRSMPLKYWHKNSKEWEVTLTSLKSLITKLDWCTWDIQAEEYVELPKASDLIPKDFHYKTKPLEHQTVGLQYGMEHDRWLLGDEQGLGKALSLDSRLYTPDGYKLMKDIKVGDTVFGRDGKPTKVTATYFHENVEMYKIKFSDGVEIKCCKDHLWRIHKGGNYKIVDTQWFLGRDQFGRPRSERLTELGYYIDRCEPVQFETKETPLDGYVVGALLGDGGITRSVGFTTADKEMVEELNKLLPDGYYLHSSPSMSDICYSIKSISETRVTSVPTIYFADGEKIGTLEDAFNWLKLQGRITTTNKSSVYSYLYPKALQHNNYRYGYHWSIKQPQNRIANKVKEALYQLDLLGKDSHTKFIPDVYKYNSVDIRYAVVQGLIDTDGYVTDQNIVQYTTVSKKLANDMQWMIESLGGMATIKEGICGYDGKITGRQYTLTIRIDNPQNLCRLSRKKDKLRTRKFKPRRKIVSIERIDNASAKCITVDNAEHLYLTDHFVVTHNTKQVIDIAVAKKLQKGYKHCFIICGVNGLKWNWVNEVHTHSNEEAYILGQEYKRGKITIGSTKDKLNDLQRLDVIPAYFIITNVETLRDKDIQAEIAKLCKSKDIGIVAIDEIHKCFDYNMRVTTNIGELKIGDIVKNHINCVVMSYNELTDQVEWKRIVDWHENIIAEPLLELQIETNSGIKTIRCTKGHRFFTKNRGWVRADDLTSYDELAEL